MNTPHRMKTTSKETESAEPGVSEWMRRKLEWLFMYLVWCWCCWCCCCCCRTLFCHHTRLSPFVFGFASWHWKRMCFYLVQFDSGFLFHIGREWWNKIDIYRVMKSTCKYTFSGIRFSVCYIDWDGTVVGPFCACSSLATAKDEQKNRERAEKTNQQITQTQWIILCMRNQLRFNIRASATSNRKPLWIIHL